MCSMPCYKTPELTTFKMTNEFFQQFEKGWHTSERHTSRALFL